MTSITMQHVKSDTKTVRQLLDDIKYKIDFFQKDYKWQTKRTPKETILLGDIGDESNEE
jgi:hypothetical protein